MIFGRIIAALLLLSSFVVSAYAEDTESVVKTAIDLYYKGQKIEARSALKPLLLKSNNPEVYHNIVKTNYPPKHIPEIFYLFGSIFYGGDISVFADELGEYSDPCEPKAEAEFKFNNAHYWYELAAVRGHTKSQYMKASLYRSGYCFDSEDATIADLATGRDVEKAYYWFRLASKKGFSPALESLILMCEEAESFIPLKKALEKAKKDELKDDNDFFQMRSWLKIVDWCTADSANFPLKDFPKAYEDLRFGL